jgi:predicted NACHT family NTPase
MPKMRIAIDDYSRRLLNAVDGNARILAVATNPMLLSLICLVHLNRNILPRGRPILYGQCVEFLIDTWDRSKGFVVAPSQIKLSQKEIILRQIAYEMQQSGKGELSRKAIEMLIETIAANNAISVPPNELLE